MVLTPDNRLRDLTPAEVAAVEASGAVPAIRAKQAEINARWWG